MKRLLKCLAVLLLLFYFPAKAAAISVFPGTNEDTKDKLPVTLPPGLQKARELPRLHDLCIAQNIHIIIRSFPEFHDNEIELIIATNNNEKK